MHPLEDRRAVVEIMTLPCAYERHGSCAGSVDIGIAKRKLPHTCFCACHHARTLHPAAGQRPLP